MLFRLIVLAAAGSLLLSQAAAQVPPDEAERIRAAFLPKVVRLTQRLNTLAAERFTPLSLPADARTELTRYYLALRQSEAETGTDGTAGDLAAMRGLIALGMASAAHGGASTMIADARGPRKSMHDELADNVMGRFCRIVCAEVGSPSLSDCGAASAASCGHLEIVEGDFSEWKDVFGGALSGEGSQLYGTEGGQNPTIPSGYTFLGQFIDHDMTAALVALRESGNEALIAEAERNNGVQVASTVNSFEAVIGEMMRPESSGGAANLEAANGRNASLDLDSVYGPFQSYSTIVDGVLTGEDPFASAAFGRLASGLPSGRFALEPVRRAEGLDAPLAFDAQGQPRASRDEVAALTGFDYPRRVDQSAIIIDGRNDENRVLAGLQTLFQLAHNDCVDFYTQAERRELPESALLLDIRTSYDLCRRQVPQVYQTIVLTDYLARTLDGATAEALLEKVEAEADDVAQELTAFNWRLRPVGEVMAALKLYEPGEEARIPESFAVAAFRLGHSQLRDSYRLQPRTYDAQGDLIAGETRPLFNVDGGGDLSGRLPLDSRTLIDWANFFSLDGTPQSSMKIDLELPPSVGRMPTKALPTVPVAATGDVADEADMPTEETDTPTEKNLGRRNILRSAARTVRPAGEDGPELTFQGTELPGAEAYLDALGLTKDADVVEELRSTLNAPESVATPLWLYILAEASAKEDGERLGPLGSKLVGEVIAGVIAADVNSVLNAGLDGNLNLPKGVEPWEPIARVRTERRFSMPDLIRHLQSHLCLASDAPLPNGAPLNVRFYGNPEAPAASSCGQAS
jgi:hypothetical protein